MDKPPATKAEPDNSHGYGNGSGDGSGNSSENSNGTSNTGNGKEEPIVVNWADGDPENPFNWPQSKKYINVLIPIYICLLTAANTTSTGVMAFWGPQWYTTSRLGFQFSVTTFLVAFSFASLLMAPLSELFGRKKIYQIATFFSAVLFIPQALSPNLGVMLSMRTLQGITASAANALVNGSVADLFGPHDRALPMNLFVLANFVGQGLAGVVLGWVGMYAGIPWCYGVQGIALGIGVVMCSTCLNETRSDVLLARRARRLTAETGVKHISPGEDTKKSMWELICWSCWRPIQYMFTEPIVTAICLWIGFNWSCMYLGMSSTLLVFGQYGWSYGILGTVQVTTILGGILGLLTSYHQEKLYAHACRRSPTGQARPEARLYWAVIGAFVFPACMYAFAWTGRPHIHWIVPAIFLTIAVSAISAMYAGVLIYLTDAYETYAASAQSAHGFSRSILAACLPLATNKMYTNLGYPIASTLVASIALVLAIAPVLIFCYGKKLRAMSKVTSSLTDGAF